MITYSFIIPHHNTPDLLQRLIDSIPQRDDIEIIIVDDNSEDSKKANILRHDIKTIYIDKEHTKGAGHARNIGMSHANGKWLLFADADDLYVANFINILDKYKNDDIDVLYFSVRSIDSQTLKPIEDAKFNRAKIYQHLIQNYDGSINRKKELMFFSWGPWNKMISHNYIKKNCILFEEISNGNDVFFALQIGYFASKIKVDKNILYLLTYFPDSITYSDKTKLKIITRINNAYHRNYFFKYLDYKQWTNLRQQESILKILFGAIKNNPKIGASVLWFFLSHFNAIYKNRKLYVNIIKK